MINGCNADFSIIVPTFKEAKNIPELIQRIGNLQLAKNQFEVILMDDHSQDGIEQIVKHLQIQYPWLRLIVRKDNKGLSESVLEGLTQAQYANYIVMDADLSHPPEKIPEMISALTAQETQMVIGSRYIKGGSSDELWPWMRKLISKGAAFVARMLIGVPVKDPLSGFFAIRKTTYEQGSHRLQPIGWKIGLELMVKCRCQHITEIPIHFSQRAHGSSKLSAKVMMNYLQHVFRLMRFKMFSV